MTRDTYDMFADRERGRFGDAESMPESGRPVQRKNFHTLDVLVHQRSASALLVSIDGDKRRAVWLPLSQINVNDWGGNARGTDTRGQVASLDRVTVEVPEWLAKEKGLL